MIPIIYNGGIGNAPLQHYNLINIASLKQKRIAFERNERREKVHYILGSEQP